MLNQRPIDQFMDKLPPITVLHTDYHELSQKYMYRRKHYPGSSRVRISLSHKHRLVVNYIRHELTNYDDLLSRAKDMGYHLKQFRVKIKQDVLKEISLSYPNLADECQAQSDKLDGVYTSYSC